MEYVIVILIAVGLLVWRDRVKGKKEEAKRREGEILRIAGQAQEIFEKIQALKTSSAKANNARKARELLERAGTYPECRQIIKNHGELIDRLEAIEKVLPAVDYVEKSYKHQFKGKDKSELNSLLDALYEIQSKGITDRDFETAMVFPEGTGELITIEGIEERCKRLGWEPS
ncbi:MAG: hypothetical protein MI794_19535 [Pseudomonadales bacterium]|nr:hypothetical protein [Pseudomonadales bacterium]